MLDLKFTTFPVVGFMNAEVVEHAVLNANKVVLIMQIRNHVEIKE